MDMAPPDRCALFIQGMFPLGHTWLLQLTAFVCFLTTIQEFWFLVDYPVALWG